MCNDKELSRIEMSETSSNLQYMRSVALPNLPLSSPVLIQKDQLEYQNITKNTIFNNFNRFINKNRIMSNTGLEYIAQFRSISLLNWINKYKLTE